MFSVVLISLPSLHVFYAYLYALLGHTSIVRSALFLAVRGADMIAQTCVADALAGNIAT